MADTKLLGTLKLNTGNVMSSIEKVNKAQQTLGQGVDLDISKFVNSQVTARLDSVQKQLAAISKTSSSSVQKISKEAQNEVKEATRLQKEQLNLQAKLQTATGPNTRDTLTQQIESRATAFSKLSESAQKAAAQTAQVTNAQDRLNLAMAKSMDKSQNMMSGAESRNANSNLAMRLQYYQDMQRSEQTMLDRNANMFVSRVGRFALNMMIDQWRSAVDYASTYYDKLNEIRMVTGKSEEEAANLGENYRKMAKEMKVTSTELSQAAVTFYRQGQNDSEVNKRMEWTTKYAKVANIDFETAATLITAATNSMGQEAERVADVFLYLGDAAGTSGEEIGKAMQKASASAKQFGLSFEWLGAYIATVSEQTRQAPESIGNAFNTMLARLHSIKQKGFNEEDATTINDVAKALKSIGVVLMDGNQWRDTSDIFSDIAEKWGELDSKQKSYIATTMAATRMQNVFFALMNDMSKGLEGGSRAFELYEGALKSAGVATEKFSVYQESVSASQASMQASLETMYSKLQVGPIKAYYDIIAGLADGISNLGGTVGVVIPIIIAAIGTLGLAMTQFGARTLTLSTILNSTKSAFLSHPIFMFATMAAATIGSFAMFGQLTGSLGAATESSEKQISDANSKIAELTAQQNNLTSSFIDLSSSTGLTGAKLSEYQGVLAQIAQLSPTCRAAVDQFTQGQKTQQDVVSEVNKVLDEQIQKQKLIRQSAAQTWLNDYKPDYSYDVTSEYQMRAFGVSTADELNAEIEAMLQERNAVDALSNSVYSILSSWGARTYNGSAVGSTLGYLGEDQWAALSKAINDYGAATGSYKDVGYYLYGRSLEYSDKLKKDAESVIDHAMQVVDYETLTSIEQGYLRQRLWDALIGSDKMLDHDDLQNASTRISEEVKFVFKSLLAGNDFGINQFLLEDVIKQIFDVPKDEVDLSAYVRNFISGSFEEIFDDAINDLAFVDSAAQKITKIYSRLQGAGLSNVDIRATMERYGISLADWLGEWDEEAFLSAWIQDTTAIDFDEYSMFHELNLESLEVVASLVRLGATTEDLLKIYQQSESVEDFVKRLKNFNDEVQKTADETKEGGQQTQDYVKQIAGYTSEIDKVQKLLDKISSGDAVTFGDLWDLREAHPKLLLFINDMTKLKNQLNEIKELDNEAIKRSLQDWMATDKGFAEASPFLAYLGDGIETLEDLKKVASASGNTGLLERIDAWLLKIAEDALKAKDNTKETVETVTAFTRTQEQYKKVAQARSALSDLDISQDSYSPERALAARETLESMFPDLAVFMHGMDKDGNISSTKTRNVTNEDYIAKALEYVNALQAEADATAQKFGVATEAEAEAAQKAQEHAEAVKEAIASLQEEVDIGQATDAGFAPQIEAIESAMTSGNVQDAVNVFNSLSEGMQNAIQDQYPRLVQAIKEAEQATGDMSDETKNLQKQISNSKWQAGVRTFKNTAKAIGDLESYTANAADAYADFYEEAEKAVKAQDEYTDASEKMSAGTEVAAEDVQNLAEFLGFITPDALLNNWDQVGPLMSAALAEGEDAQNRLNDAAFIRITGTSDADFSAIEAGLISVQGMAADTLAALAATGQWDLETLDLPQTAAVWHPGVDGGGHWSFETMTAGATVLKASGKNPFSSGKTPTAKKGGGGGGGGGGGNKNGMTEVERMLDRQRQIQTIQGHTKNLYAAQADYYEQTGELQGVIRYTEKEAEALREQTKTLEENVAEMEPWLEKKKAELAALKTTDSEYAEVSDDLKQLQDQHQNYTLQLIKNKTELDKLTKAIKEQHDAIRSMEIDLRNTILDAIKDREALNDRMLQGTINTENAILEMIQKRYEKERDLILENSDKQIESLQKERDLQSEQLELRKKQAEEEDKAAKLAELEAKYARISADPTRRKEALEIQRDINDLRDEMAWDLAEKEVEAQQDAIDQQIESIEDYKEYIEKYYEDLFEHPKKLIDEMKQIIVGTDDEIIEWLKKNSEDYADKTEATQEDMVNGWTEMLRDMHGEIVTYWDEIESIIEGGDDAIISFLKENTEAYKEAGQMQAEAYVDEWMKKLDDLHLAHKAVTDELKETEYQYIAPNEGDGKSGGQGGGPSSPGNKNTSNDETSKGNMEHGYRFTFNGKKYSNTGYQTEAQAANAAQTAFGSLWSQAEGGLTRQQGSSEAAKQKMQDWRKTIVAYKRGGLADYSGPAWVDGSPSDPERILSPLQTSLFESLVHSLEAMSRVSIMGMPYFGEEFASGNNPYSVGDIIVNVDKLETDEDYEEIANHVFGIIMDRLNRGAVVGGIRLR